MAESLKTAGLVLVFVWFFAGGIGHFVATDTFQSVVPSYVPYPRKVVLTTGACEIAGALALLIERLRRPAGLALIAFAVCVTPVHIEMLRESERYPQFGEAALWIRLALQPVLIWIIWEVTKPHSPQSPSSAQRSK